MSAAFLPKEVRESEDSPTPELVRKMLNENTHLMQAIVDYQNKGRVTEVHQYMQVLHRNLVFLASIADAVPSRLPCPSQVLVPLPVQLISDPVISSLEDQRPFGSPNQI